MNCQKCKSTRVLTEGQGDGKTKVTCQECGESRILDTQGRRMLTDDMPATSRTQILTERS